MKRTKVGMCEKEVEREKFKGAKGVKGGGKDKGEKVKGCESREKVKRQKYKGEKRRELQHPVILLSCLKEVECGGVPEMQRPQNRCGGSGVVFF